MSDRPKQVIPLRYVASVDALRDYYLDVLGFEHAMGIVGADGEFDFAIVALDGAMLMLSRPTDSSGLTQGALELFVEVADVDAYHERLAARGVAIAERLQTQWWGDRNFAIDDAAGHRLWFWQTVAEPSPPPGVTMI